MGLLLDKFKEVMASVLPITLIVLLLSFTLVPIPQDMLFRFIFGALLIIAGLAIFLWGAELGVQEMGEQFGKMVARSNGYAPVAILGFLLGFLITVAEPDLLILGNQISDATSGLLNAWTIVIVVSIGVGIMVAVGLFRILLEKSYRVMMTVTYAIIAALAIFVSEEFLAMSVDASGATTGAMTTPFILALGLGVSILKGGDTAEEDSFGMVGVMSAGPILAVMIMSIVKNLTNIQGEAAVFQTSQGVIGPIIEAFPHYFQESLIALLPITILFFISNHLKMKLPQRELVRILKGLVYTFIGLVLFLTGVNTGFMEVGRVMGSSIAGLSQQWILPLVGLLMGMVVVLAEPAVYVLGTQVEDVTGGHISRKTLLVTLSVGVALAVCFSMLRIMVPALKLWHFLLPGFGSAVVLSYQVKPIFTGIAFDAGGVASGPMTATFVLAFAQGAADAIPTANVLVDGFGVIAMVAMTPVVAIHILGLIYRFKSKKGGIE